MNLNNKEDIYWRHYTDDLYTREEARKVLDAIKKHEQNDALERSMKKTWHESELLMGLPEAVNDSYQKEARDILSEQQEEKHIRIPLRPLKRALSIAASVLILFAVGTGIYRYTTQSGVRATAYTEASTTYGQTKTLTLPDGTQVVLNACSEISYPTQFSGKERRVTLKGEAYFQVVKNEEQAFSIHTENFNIRVLGTAFNVKAYEGDEIQSVNVEHGKVQVDMPEAMTRLVAKEQIEINTQTHSYAKDKSEYADIAVWRKGHLRFVKTPLADVARQLERVYDCRISLEQGRSFHNLISGEHDNENLKEVLESIRLATGVNWKTGKSPEEIILYK